MESYILLIVIGCIALYIFISYCLKVIADKTGHEDSSWMAWIPIANFILMLKIAERPMWWALVLLLGLLPDMLQLVGSVIQIILSLIIWMDIAKKRGHESWWGILAAFIIGIPYIAFAEGNKPATAEAEI